jgi:hypothetical protein
MLESKEKDTCQVISTSKNSDNHNLEWFYSGGPLQQQNKNGYWFQYGITSFGYGCAEKDIQEFIPEFRHIVISSSMLLKERWNTKTQTPTDFLVKITFFQILLYFFVSKLFTVYFYNKNDSIMCLFSYYLERDEHRVRLWKSREQD